MSKKLTASERAYFRKLIQDKLDIDYMVGQSQKGGVPREPVRMSFSEKAKQVNAIINDLKEESINDILSQLSFRDKEKMFDRYIEEINESKKDKEKKRIDREAEKLRGKPGNYPTSRRKLAQDIIRDLQKDTPPARPYIPRTTSEVPPPFSRLNQTVNVFDYMNSQLNNTTITNEQVDFNWYRSKLRRYGNLETTDRWMRMNNRIEDAIPIRGKFYNYSYSARTFPEIMDRYDSNPLVYILNAPSRSESNNMYFKGYNFHWLTSYRQRYEIVESILNTGLLPSSVPVQGFHTYALAEDTMLSPLYSIYNNEIKTAVLLPLERFIYR